MRYHRVTDETVQRLPFYLRGVLQLSEQGVESISSRRFAEHIGVLSFSPQRLVIPPRIKLIAIDIAMDLVRLPYYMPKS